MSQGVETPKRPLVGYTPLAVAWRYLLKKKLSYLAIVGIALSVGTLIVVMSVFTGFHDTLVGSIRGYLSDVSIKPSDGGLYGMKNWQAWHDYVRGQDHVEGAAPYIQGFGLLRGKYNEGLTHVAVRGVHPQFEPEVSDLPEFIPEPFELGDLSVRAPVRHDRDAGPVDSVFLGSQFLARTEEDARELAMSAPQVILVTATPDLQRKLKVFAVRGTFQTGNTEYDSKMALMSLETAADFVGADRAVSGMSLRLDDFEQHGDQAVKALRKALSPGVKLVEYTAGTPGAVAVSGDGTRVGFVGEDGSVSVLLAATGEELFALPAGDSAVTALALESDGEHLLLGRRDGTAEVHRVGDGKSLRIAGAAGVAVTAAAYAPDGLKVALGYDNGAVQLLYSPDLEIDDEESDLSISDWTDHSAAVGVLAFSRDSLHLASGADDASVVWRDLEEERVRARGRAAGAVSALAFSPQAYQLAAGSADSEAVTVVRSGWSATMRQSPTGGVLALAWPGSSLVVAGPDGLARERPLEEGEMPRGSALPLKNVAPAGNVQLAALSSGGDYAVYAGAGSTRLVYTGPKFTVQTWQDQNSVFLEAVGMERFLMALIVSLILVVAEFLIFTIVTTIVAERRRDIGILKAVGFTRTQICKVFLTVGMAVGTIGAALGVGGGLLFVANINGIRELLKNALGFDPFPADVYYFSEIPTRVTPLVIILTAAGAILCALLFSLLPALRAARMDPVQTLQFE
jgi:ABC-type lipoprotein release transport system permease subunit